MDSLIQTITVYALPVLFVVSEMADYIKAGGLGDVAAAAILGDALRAPPSVVSMAIVQPRTSGTSQGIVSCAKAPQVKVASVAAATPILSNPCMASPFPSLLN